MSSEERGLTLLISVLSTSTLNCNIYRQVLVLLVLSDSDEMIPVNKFSVPLVTEQYHVFEFLHFSTFLSQKKVIEPQENQMYEMVQYQHTCTYMSKRTYMSSPYTSTVQRYRYGGRLRVFYWYLDCTCTYSTGTCIYSYLYSYEYSTCIILLSVPVL